MIKVRIGKKKSPCGEAKKVGFGQGTPPKGEWYKKQEIFLEEEDENNPWAICTASVGRKDKDKYERCVQSVKRKNNK